jgi:ATP-binding protein involved in chromosome partitioning
MRIAIPVAEGALAAHFGHCQHFGFFEVDDDGQVTGPEYIVPPVHAPGVLPKWLAENKADMIIAGGMGSRAQNLFVEAGVKVLIGAPSIAPEKIVEAFLNNSLQTGDNLCDH